MPEPRAENTAPMPWRVPVAVADIPENGKSFALVADGAMRAVVARNAGLRELPRLEANFTVRREGSGGLHVIGRVSATVGQNCVVTLEPLVNEIEEDIDLVFMPPAAAAPSAGRSGGEAEAVRPVNADDPEPLIGGVVDVGGLAIEFLILGLDPYPRKPGAVFEPPRQAAGAASPFAALAGWTKGRDGT